MFAHEIFWYCETKNYQQKIVKSPHCPYVFSITDFSETQKCSPTTFFGNVRQIIWKKIVIHPPLLLSIKTFDTRSFLTQRRILLRSFFVTVRQKIWQKLVKQPLFSYALNVSIPETFLKHRSFLLRNVSVRWDKTVCAQNRDTNPLSYT